MPRLHLWLLLSSFLFMTFPGFGASASKNTVIHQRIDGTIHSGTTSLIEAGIKKAEETGAEAFLIELDTPGGLLDSTRDIVKLFLNTDVPIIVFVSPRGAHAGSAGTFITLAAHVAAMAPGTNIGAAHPVSITGADPEKDGKHMAQKIENDTIAFIENIAKQRGRNLEWAKKSVLESASVTEEKAKELNVIDFVAKNVEDVLARTDGLKIKTPKGDRTLHTKDATLVSLDVDSYTQLKNWLAHPSVMFILIIIAGLGIYVEMSHPGIIFPAVAAGVAILLLLIANSVLPLSVIGLGLIILGFALLLMEIYVTSFGLLAIGGLIAFGFGAYLLFDPSESDLHVPRPYIWSALAAIGTIATIIGFAVSRTMALKQLTGQEGMVGQTATVDQPIEPGKPGKIFLGGEFWEAVGDEFLSAGDRVEVISIDGLRARVRRVKGS